jgi:hypothetical protein
VYRIKKLKKRSRSARAVESEREHGTANVNISVISFQLLYVAVNRLIIHCQGTVRVKLGKNLVDPKA